MFQRITIFLIAILGAINTSLVSAQEVALEEVEDGRTSILLQLMEDAPYVQEKYLVRTRVESDYKVDSYRAYFYSNQLDAMDRINDDFIALTSNILEFNFKHDYHEAPFLVLEIKYGPNFLYDQNAVGICVVPFIQGTVFEPIECNPLTTAKYLLAAVISEAGDDIFTHKVIEQYKALSKLPQEKFWQDYLAIHQLILAHIAEIEDYKIAHSGQYIEIGYKIFEALLKDVRQIRRMNVNLLDNATLSADRSMVNFAYRLYMNLEGLLNRNLYLLEKVEESPEFIRDFFSGLVSFALLTQNSDVVANLTQENNQISFNLWPWFESVRVQFDDGEPLVSRKSVHVIPEDAERVDITAVGGSARYAILRYSIIKNSNVKEEGKDPVNESPQNASVLNGVTSDNETF
jgi:hypothetical protein